MDSTAADEDRSGIHSGLLLLSRRFPWHPDTSPCPSMRKRKSTEHALSVDLVPLTVLDTVFLYLRARNGCPLVLGPSALPLNRDRHSKPCMAV